MDEENKYILGRVEVHDRKIQDLERSYHNLDTRVVIGEKDRERMTADQRELKNDHKVLREDHTALEKGLASIDRRLFQIISLGAISAFVYMANEVGLIEAIKTLL